MSNESRWRASATRDLNVLTSGALACDGKDENVKSCRKSRTTRGTAATVLPLAVLLFVVAAYVFSPTVQTFKEDFREGLRPLTFRSVAAQKRKGDVLVPFKSKPSDAQQDVQRSAMDPFDTQYDKYACVPCHNATLARYRPYAYIIGAEKGGTTALLSYLKRHPDIAPHMKETYVLQPTYNKRYGYGDEGGPVDQCGVFQLYKEWYMEDGGIDDVDRGLKYIDKTPYYIFAGPHVAQRLLCADPHAKMIVLLRNPVDRAYSGYNVSARDATTLHATLSCHAAMHGMQCARKVC